jgi:hypothetical protein
MLASEKENEYEIPNEGHAKDHKKASPHQTLKKSLENNTRGLKLATSSSEVLMDNTKNQDKKLENEELLPLIESKLSETQSSVSATGVGNNRISSETKNVDDKNTTPLAINEFQTVKKPSENIIFEEVVENEMMGDENEKTAQQFGLDDKILLDDQSGGKIDIENITTIVSGIEDKSDFEMNENQDNNIFRTDLMNELMEETMDAAEGTRSMWGILEQQNTRHLKTSDCLDEKVNTNPNQTQSFQMSCILLF